MVDKFFKSIFSTVDATIGKEQNIKTEKIVEKNLVKTLETHLDKT
jgi:hypothetical protein